MIQPQSQEIPFRLTDAEGHRLATNVVVVIKSRRQLKQLVSDADGRLLLPVSDTYLRENPQITWNYPGALTWAFNATASSGPGTNRATVYVSLPDKQKLVHGDLTVFYPPGFATPARETMCELEGARDFIARTLGLKPPSWGIVLLPEAETNTDYLVSGELESAQTWNYAIADLQSGKLAQVNTHEWTEKALDVELSLYRTDRRNRFIGDGLAEWMSWQRAGLPKGYTQPLAVLAQQGKHHVNLLEQFRSVQVSVSRFRGKTTHQRRWQQQVVQQAFPPGYALSLAFWHRLCEAHGADLPARFVARLRLESKRDAPAAIRILGELTGEKDIARRLSQADILESITRVQGLESGEKIKPTDE